jgi:hypothetical protein
LINTFRHVPSSGRNLLDLCADAGTLLDLYSQHLLCRHKFAPIPVQFHLSLALGDFAPSPPLPPPEGYHADRETPEDFARFLSFHDCPCRDLIGGEEDKSAQGGCCDAYNENTAHHGHRGNYPAEVCRCNHIPAGARRNAGKYKPGRIHDVEIILLVELVPKYGPDLRVVQKTVFVI